MRRISSISAIAIIFVVSQAAPVLPLSKQNPGEGAVNWPTHGWTNATPSSAGLDEKILAEIDKDFASGKYPLVDSFAAMRCGALVYERKYPHDYAQTYGKQAGLRGPLNAHLTGPYNYFDPAWHPYYRGTALHSMQSVSKTVSSVILGIAITRGDFKAGLDTPVLHYFDPAKVKDVDDRKRRITLRHVLTMSTGLEWNEEAAYDDPRNDSSLMEAADDWVEYVIGRPMAHEPGKVFNYSSGDAELLAHIFQKETGQDIESYGQQYLFSPLGVEHYWKRTPLAVVDTEGGLYLSGADLAKIGYLYLRDGVWDGQRVVSKDWVKLSLTPLMDTGEEGRRQGFRYGFFWWLLPRTDAPGYVWMARGFGGQRLMVFPDKDLILVFTAWDILGDPVSNRELVRRILPAVRTHACGDTAR